MCCQAESKKNRVRKGTQKLVRNDLPQITVMPKQTLQKCSSVGIKTTKPLPEIDYDIKLSSQPVEFA